MKKAFLINLILWLILLLVFTTTQLPGDTIFWRSLQNAGHGLAMCFAAFIGISTLRSKLSSRRLMIPIAICIALFVLSVLIEAIQHVIGRGASSKDILMDTAGIAAGVSFGIIVSNKRRLSSNRFLLLLGLTLFAYIIYLPTFHLIANRSAPTLPVLANFDQFFSHAKLQSSGAEFSIGDHRSIWPSSTKKSVLVEYSPAKWPYLRFAETAANWSSYNHLTLEVFNSEESDIRLNIRVDYKLPNTNGRSFMIARRIIPPGHTSIDIPFSELIIEHYNGEPDFEKIDSVMIYLASPTDNVSLYFDNLILH